MLHEQPDIHSSYHFEPAGIAYGKLADADHTVDDSKRGHDVCRLDCSSLGLPLGICLELPLVSGIGLLHFVLWKRPFRGDRPGHCWSNCEMFKTELTATSAGNKAIKNSVAPKCRIWLKAPYAPPWMM